MRAEVSSDDLVTGEAVVVALPYAGVPIRALSGLVDVAVHTLLIVALIYGLTRVADGLDEALIAAFTLLISVFAIVAFPSLCEATTGRTIGKKLTGLRTVRTDGAPADPRRIITRHLLGVVEIWLTTGSIALVTALFTHPTRRLGDLAAGTYVARDRIRLALPRPPRMPPGLAAWARGADLAHLPEDLVAMVRTTLAQSTEFTTSAAERVEAMLATRVLEHVAPPPPTGTPARDVLLAVMAERREREVRRLEAAEDRRRRLFGERPVNP